MGIKIFDDLRREVVESNLCNLCGACLAVCSANEMNALCLEENIPQYIKEFDDVQKCLECGLCYLVCGQISDLDPKIDALFAPAPPIGSYRLLTCAKTTDPKIQKRAQDGGVVTSVLKYLLDKNLIDGAVVNIPTSNWESSPKIVTSVEELLQSTGTRYSAVPAVQELGNFQTLNKESPRLAFVGCPCQVKTVRKMQELQMRPGIFVKYVIGLFCMENFDYQKLMKGKFEKDLKIDLNNIKKLNIKKNFFITLKDNKQIEIPLKELSDLVRNNCHFCDDFTNFYADISVGGVGAPAGYSTVILRTQIGDKIFYDMKRAKEIEEVNSPPADLKKIRANVFSQISRLGQIKYDRGKKKKLEINKSG